MSEAETRVPGPGDLPPDFALAADDGAVLRLADLRGQPAVVYFYPKDDTPGCTKEALGFSALASSFADAGVRVVGVSRDSVRKHASFKAKHGLHLTLVSDAEGTMTDAWGMWVEKSLYGRRYMGIERATFLLDREGRVAQVWRQVRVGGHAEAVLEAALKL